MLVRIHLIAVARIGNHEALRAGARQNCACIVESRPDAAPSMMLVKAGATRPGGRMKRGGGANVGSRKIQSRKIRAEMCVRRGERQGGKCAGIPDRVTHVVRNRGQFEWHLLVRR